jgi:peptide chain release factor 2
MPELDDSVVIDINPADLKLDTYRASGAGGQHINTTDSAVRITHIPTGVVVQCQNERSQTANRATAMKMLMGKLVELKEREHKDKIEDLAGDYSQITWGSQIRSYVFHPYNMVKDHRTNEEVGNIQAVMDGEIDCFIDAYLRGASTHGNESN